VRPKSSIFLSRPLTLQPTSVGFFLCKGLIMACKGKGKKGYGKGKRK
jgi:hypothetical protein